MFEIRQNTSAFYHRKIRLSRDISGENHWKNRGFPCIIQGIERSPSAVDGLGEKENDKMVRELMHDPVFLGRKSQAAEMEDRVIGQDLRDTLRAHRDSCVGMAANMIGELKNIIVFDWEGEITVFYNPRILKTWEPYETEEGCLSLLGGLRKTKRFRRIKVEYENEAGQKRLKTFSGFTAQIIQHEVDHCNGVLI